MVGNIPIILICPISGRQYVYKPFLGLRDTMRSENLPLRIIAYSPEPSSSGKRCILEGDWGMAMVVTESEFQVILAHNLEYDETKNKKK